MLDDFVYGEVTRISPEAPTPAAPIMMRIQPRGDLIGFAPQFIFPLRAEN